MVNGALIKGGPPLVAASGRPRPLRLEREKPGRPNKTTKSSQSRPRTRLHSACSRRGSMFDWAAHAGGTLEDRPRYNKGATFDPFPFPNPSPEQRIVIADIGEELDSTRKAALAEHQRLTMTGLYNLGAKLRAGAALTKAEEIDVRDARARIVLHLHDQLDAAVAAAYGWPVDLAPAEIVTRLVQLNAERAVKEAAGHVQWLRAEYQVPRFGS